MEKPSIAKIRIDVMNRTIEAFDADGNGIVHPLTNSGSSLIRYTKVSQGGLIIQALTRMLDDPDDRYYR